MLKEDLTAPVLHCSCVTDWLLSNPILSQGQPPPILEKAFADADSDKDGTITFDEFCKAASSIGLGVSETELRIAFDRFDINRDKTIETDEFLNLMCPRVITHADRQAAVAVEHLERIATKRTALGVEDDNVKGAVRKVAQVVFDRELNVRRAFQTWTRMGLAIWTLASSPPQ